ncbi:class I adenylate cyclase [Nitrospina gracilis]|uniref:class I adenylate cyclase n=1 Tax=Nitrospina gracilis TaxID=35801 RepID=UPI001F00BEB6|nr:class I adenylate cyclase [Nitrospina gracilis]MCF8720471.1 adenylate cyclase class 1 [Nitrospina gracilis Nb-211]
MADKPENIAEELFNNRQIFLRYNQNNINRIQQPLFHVDRHVFTIIPRLLHINQEGLPGYVKGDVPCGIHHFQLDHRIQLAAETLFPDAIFRGNEEVEPFIHTILLMGSCGSIAQSRKSDLDYTLLVNKHSVSPERLGLFKQKLNLIEKWAWDEFNLEVHFFINDIQEVKNNIFGESDTESTGSAQAKLLKEEMYRTAVVTTGKLPFWWIVPLQTDDDQYENYLHLLRTRQTLLDPDAFVDIGNVDDISQGEFFGGSIWALIKSFKAPFKTLLKMGLLEEYMFGQTRFNLLCHEIKKKVFGGTLFDDIDTYVAMYERVERFFKEHKDENALDALKTSFVLKVGTKVTGEELVKGSPDPRKRTLINMYNSWDWEPAKLESVNAYFSWQMLDKVALGNRINKILMASYKNISEANKASGEESLISERDTHLLGRKLFSFYRPSQNKVENLFALVDGETGEKELTFMIHRVNPKDKGEWYLIRGKTLAFLEHIPKEQILKKAYSLQFLVAFTCFNSLFRKDTVLLLRAEQQSIKDQDLKILLEDLSSFMSQVSVASIPNEDLLTNARLRQLFMIVDFGNPIPREVMIGNLHDCKTPKEYAGFMNRKLERITSTTAIYLTTWGELFCKTYVGANCMNRCLAELRPMTPNREIDEDEFFKFFVPGSRKEKIDFSWLSRYIIKTLTFKKGNTSGKVESPDLKIHPSTSKSTSEGAREMEEAKSESPST